MDSKEALQQSTIKYFDSVNFGELNDRWIDDVIENEFTEGEENNITINILFVNDPVQTLNKLSKICLAWCDQSVENDESAISENLNDSCREEVLWTILDKLTISVKHIQGIVYLLCSRAMKKGVSTDDKALGLAGAKLYFCCLRVPGSGAYSIYHPNLFHLCIDCMPAPDFTSDKDNESMREFERLSATYVTALQSLIPLLKEFHLGDDTSTVEHTIKKLVEMTACEVQSHINFNVNFAETDYREMRRYKPTLIVSSLAYQALLAILDTDLNGDKEINYVVILSYLNKSVLCYKARKCQTISQKHLVVKDNALAFICHNLKTKEFCSEATQIGLKRLCIGVVDKAEIRNIVSAAIINILFHLKSEHLVEIIQWILLLIDSADTKDRVFALDVLGQLLSNTFEVDPNFLPESLKNDSLNVPIIFAILTRCDDISPAVRTKALTVVSQNMKCILKFLDKTKDQASFEFEESEDSEDRDLDVNGNHRYFWYNKTSFRERLNEIAEIIQRRIEDNNVTARKAALIALENLILFDHTYITEENLKFYVAAAKDTNIVVRKQMIQSLNVILEAYSTRSEIQEAWLKCVLPLIQDPENTVQAKTLLVLEEQFLQKLFSSVQVDSEYAFLLLKLLSSGDFLAHQRYFQKAFSIWKSENKLRPQSIIRLEKYIGTEWEECVWFFISNFAVYSSLPSRIADCCLEQFEKFHLAGEYPSFMEYVVKVLMHIFQRLSTDKLERVQSIICNNLKLFSVPVELIPIYIEILYKILRHLKSESEFSNFSSMVIQICEEHLQKIKSQSSFSEALFEELLPKYFCTIKECCQLCSSNITPSIVSLLQAYSAAVELPKQFLEILTPSLKAHAFAALGKICLQDEMLAKELLPVYAKELLTSTHDVIRNNIVIILIEMCKRYTSFADKYVPLISLCFKDKLYLIRYQTIILVVNLLQEGYIKWRGPLFFCLLSTLVDEKVDIQALGRYSLSQLLQDKKKNLFSEHFIDSIFIFNNFPPPDNETVAQIVKDLERFALPGEGRREERLLLYRFLLESMEVKDKALLIKSIGEILSNVAESVYPLDKMTECIIRDCFAILICKEIRAYNVEQFEDMDELTETEVFKTELDMRRVVVIDPIIPVISNLKNIITDSRSDMYYDIIYFLKDLLHDYKDGINDILAVDKMLLNLVELTVRTDTEYERKSKRIEKELKDKNKHTNEQQPEQTPATITGSTETICEDNATHTEDKGDEETAETTKVPSPTNARNLRKLSQHIIHEEDRTSTSTDRSSTTQPLTYNIATSTPAEASEIERLARLPRVVLTKCHLTSDIFNTDTSAITNEPMNVDESNDD